MLVARHSRSQHYSTLFNPRTGFFARVEDKGHPEPFWSRQGPEMIDIAITNWCDRECAVCYRCSDTTGSHMSLRAYRDILNQAARIGVLQVALGGGNPNQHPDFEEILRTTRADFGIVPSYTTNGRGLSTLIVEETARYCGAVAVSAYEPYGETWRAVHKLREAGVKTNIHFVLDAGSVGTAIAWMRDSPQEMEGVNALVFLNYKPSGRLDPARNLLRASPRVAEFFGLACAHSHPFRVGFDSCLVSGLVTYSQVNPVWFDACEAARFSMFISEKSYAHPCSFMETLTSGEQVTDKNLQQIWQRSQLFLSARRSILNNLCPHCAHQGVCRGGCHAYPEINLCQKSQGQTPAQGNSGAAVSDY
jgi:radical SAM protein with 4Fe4S-binding SPASM domain